MTFYRNERKKKSESRRTAKKLAFGIFVEL